MARVPYVDPADVPAEHRDLLNSRLQGKPLNLYRALGNAPAVLVGFRGHLEALWSETGLTERERELVILASAAAVGSRYEWHQHVNIARDAGIDDEAIYAVTAFACEDPETLADADALADAGLDADERALVAYVRAVVRGETDDALHAALAEHYPTDTVVGVAVIAGTYTGLAHVIDALKLDLEADEEPLHEWDPR
ncbi:hypothetical protein GCM10027435_01620 [Haloparvum alkalitolerans]|uniref:carboxymuconolactone decarboxylase family protein n=1 Tax=Haloparvum alkalitolerans TaxID=1042953 RepID=UPI003CEF85B2